MVSKRVRVKLLLLLVLAASAVGLGGKASACGAQCVLIFDHGRLIGYGCVTAQTGNCIASGSGCDQSGC